MLLDVNAYRSTNCELCLRPLSFSNAHGPESALKIALAFGEIRFNQLVHSVIVAKQHFCRSALKLSQVVPNSESRLCGSPRNEFHTWIISQQQANAYLIVDPYDTEFADHEGFESETEWRHVVQVPHEAWQVMLWNQESTHQGSIEGGTNYRNDLYTCIRSTNSSPLEWRTLNLCEPSGSRQSPEGVFSFLRHTGHCRWQTCKPVSLVQHPENLCVCQNKAESPRL